LTLCQNFAIVYIDNIQQKMNTAPKSPELLTAQAALYAANQKEKETPGRERAILGSLADMALHQAVLPDTLTYPINTTIRRYIDGEFVAIANKGDAMTMFDKQEYVEFLANPANRELSRRLSDLVAGYDKVAPIIDELGMIGLDLATAREHPNFLANGGSMMAFQFNGTVDGEDKQMVALFAQNPQSSLHVVNSRAICLATAEGLDGFEKGVGVSYNPPVVVAEMALGKDMASMSHQERLAIPQEHWDALMENVMAASERGIEVDTNSDNFIYSPQSGFTVIDFRLGNGSRTGAEAKEYEAKAITEFRDKMLASETVKRN
jgi:hypothetical protein